MYQAGEHWQNRPMNNPVDLELFRYAVYGLVCAVVIALLLRCLMKPRRKPIEGRRRNYRCLTITLPLDGGATDEPGAKKEPAAELSRM